MEKMSYTRMTTPVRPSHAIYYKDRSLIQSSFSNLVYNDVSGYKLLESIPTYIRHQSVSLIEVFKSLEAFSTLYNNRWELTYSPSISRG